VENYNYCEVKIIWKKLSVVPVEKEDPELIVEKIGILITTD
jgi:hypothetical protein